ADAGNGADAAAPPDDEASRIDEGGPLDPEISPDVDDTPEEPSGEIEVAPPVVAVVVTSGTGEWLAPALESLAGQDYPALSVLVLDNAASDDPTARIAAELPTAYVRRLPTRVSFAAAANEALHTVEGATFLLFCHDDVAFDPDAVRVMVE